jgi:hypothetical protein
LLLLKKEILFSSTLPERIGVGTINNTTNVVIEEQAEVVPTSELYRGSITVGTELAVCSYKGKTVAVAAFTPVTDGSKTVYFEVFSNDTVKVTIEGTSYTAPAELVALFR